MKLPFSSEDTIFIYKRIVDLYAINFGVNNLNSDYILRLHFSNSAYGSKYTDFGFDNEEQALYTKEFLDNLIK